MKTHKMESVFSVYLPLSYVPFYLFFSIHRCFYLVAVSKGRIHRNLRLSLPATPHFDCVSHTGDFHFLLFLEISFIFLFLCIYSVCLSICVSSYPLFLSVSFVPSFSLNSAFYVVLTCSLFQKQ